MPSVKSAAQESLDTIGALLARMQKRAAAESDPGGFDGPTSHQTANQDNDTEDPQEGVHASELDSDIKEDHPVGVNNATVGMAGGQDAAQVNIGTQQSDADSTEGNIPDVASDLPDPGGYDGDSSHQTADKPNTEKYGAARNLRSQLEQVKEAGSALLAKIVMSSGTTPVKTADEKLPAKTPGAASGSEDATPTAIPGGEGESSEEKEAAAGAKMAEAAILAKQQRDASVVQGITDTIKSAHSNASITADYLDGFFAQAGKLAGDEESSDDTEGDDSGEGSADESTSSSSDGPPVGGDAGGAGGDAGGDPTSGGSGGIDENALMQLLSGGGGGDMGAGGEAGGIPGGGGDIGGGGAVEQMLGGAPGGGGDPMGGGGMPGGMGADPMGGGGMPGGGDPMAGGGMGGGMGGGGDEQQMAMLAEALAQAGISPQELQQAVQQKAAQKRAATKKSFGGWAPRSQKEAEQFERMKQVVTELVS